MGLDQFAYVTKTEPPASVDFEENINFKEFIEIYYWRKDYYLQYWMCDLYIKKGGVNDFNCNMLLLTLEDIDELKKYIESDDYKKLPDYSKSEQDDNIKFCKKAKEILEEGDKYIIYYSWW